jgi:hypothetical protein
MAELTKKEEIAAKVAAGIFASGYNQGAPDFRQIASDSLTMAEAILEEAKRRQES